jgi:hypothetical protein
MVCVPVVSLSVSTSVPVGEPAEVGENVTLIVQVALAAILVPQLLACAKPVLATMLVIAIAVVVLVLVTTTGLAALVVPTACAANVSDSELGLKVSDEATAGTWSVATRPSWSEVR